MENKIKEALEYFNKKDYNKALDIFNEVLENDKNNPNIISNIGLCYANLNDNDKAQEFYLKALNIDNKMVQTIVNLSDSYVKTNKILEAIDLLQTAVYNLPDISVLKHYLARVYSIDKRYEEACFVLNEILDENPKDIDANWDLGVISFEQGDYQSAISYFENVIEQKDDNPAIFYKTALAYEANDEIDKAISYLLRAIVLNENFEIAYKKLGIFFMAKGDKRSAIDYFEDYLNFNLSDDEKKQVEALINKIK